MKSPSPVVVVVLAVLIGGGVVSGVSAQGRESAAALAEPADVDAGAVTDADASEAESPLGLEVLVGTAVPVDVSVGARLFVLDRLFVSGAVGRATYGSLWSGIAQGTVGDAGATLIDPLFEDAWIARVGLGLRPFGDTGVEVTVGYARLWTSATWDAAVAAEALGWQDGASGTLGASIGIDAFYVELGVTLKLFDWIVLRPAIGWMQTTSASASLTTSMDVPPEMETMLAEGEAAVAGAIERYGMAPTMGLSVGFEL